MTDASLQSRHPQGAPDSTGGQFAAEARHESLVALSSNDVVPTSVADEEPVHPQYEFPTGRLGIATKSIDAANKKLERAGITSRFEYNAESFVKTKIVDENGHRTTRMVEHTRITLSSPTISYGGYQFLAVLEQEEAGLVTKAAPGVELEGWRPDSMLCDHCGRDIARQKTYLLSGVDGQRVQVGSTCVEPYLGVRPTGLWALGFDPLDDAMAYDEDDYFGEGSSHSQVQPVRHTLAVALAVSDQGRGFVSSSQARDLGTPSTASMVDNVLFPPSRLSNDEARWRETALAAAQQYEANGTVQRVLDDIEDLDTSSDWSYNLRTVARGEYVSWKNATLLVSALSAYRRAHDRRVEDESRLTAAIPGFMASVGEKVKGAKVTVTKVRHTTAYDMYARGDVTRSQVVMRDGAGHEVVWWASSRQDIEEGQEMVLTGGSVKKHGTYQGVDQTVLTRVKMEPVPIADDAG